MPRRRKHAPRVVGAGDELHSRFKLALAFSKITEAAFAREYGVTQTHLRETITGGRKGADLLQHVIEWTAEKEVAMREQMAKATVLVA